MPDSLKAASILVVDDDEGLLILMAEAFRAEGCEVATAGSGAEALAWLARQTPDLMLLDLKMKDVGGQALLERLRQDRSPVPFVVVTGQGDEKVAVEVMKQGALDYVMKDTGLLDLLPVVVKRALTVLERDRALAAAQVERQRLEKELLQISEREQQRIGEDLHDGLGQQLTAIEMLCTGLKEDVAGQPELSRQVEQIGQFLRESISQVRLMARGLVPVKDDPEALQVSLIALAERTNSLRRLRCRLECPTPVLFDGSATAGHLYRIAQEAVNNAVKHSQAAEVVIRLVQHPVLLELQVTDNGKGFPKGRSDGMGLHVMKHRASVIGAELMVESKPGKGVTITCRLQRTP